MSCSSCRHHGRIFILFYQEIQATLRRVISDHDDLEELPYMHDSLVVGIVLFLSVTECQERRVWFRTGSEMFTSCSILFDECAAYPPVYAVCSLRDLTNQLSHACNSWIICGESHPSFIWEKKGILSCWVQRRSCGDQYFKKMRQLVNSWSTFLRRVYRFVF